MGGEGGGLKWYTIMGTIEEKRNWQVAGTARGDGPLTK